MFVWVAFAGCFFVLLFCLIGLGFGVYFGWVLLILRLKVFVDDYFVVPFC